METERQQEAGSGVRQETEYAGMAPENQYDQCFLDGQDLYGSRGAKAPPADKHGQPLKNQYALRIVLSVLEIVCCNLISMVCGIIGCIYTGRANISYNQGRWDDFKAQSKAAAISLWVGLAGFILEVIVFIVMIVTIIGGLRQQYNNYYNTSENGSGYESSADTGRSMNAAYSVPSVFRRAETISFFEN